MKIFYVVKVLTHEGVTAYPHIGDTYEKALEYLENFNHAGAVYLTIEKMFTADSRKFAGYFLKDSLNQLKKYKENKND